MCYSNSSVVNVNKLHSQIIAWILALCFILFALLSLRLPHSYLYQLFKRETEIDFCQLILKLAEEIESLPKLSPHFIRLMAAFLLCVHHSNLDISLILFKHLSLLSLYISFPSAGLKTVPALCQHFTQMDSAGFLTSQLGVILQFANRKKRKAFFLYFLTV